MPTNGVFSSQSLLWVPRAFPVYKFGNRSSSKAGSKGAWVFIQQFLPGFGGGLLLGVLFIFGLPSWAKCHYIAL